MESCDEEINKEISRLGTMYGKMTQAEEAMGITCMPGIKHDSQKLRWELLPWSEIEDMVRSLTFGAVKYEDDNWKKVEPAFKRYTGAMMRHIMTHLKGETFDKESGVPHLAVAAVNALFLLWHHKKEYPKEYEDYQSVCSNLFLKAQDKKELATSVLRARELGDQD